jgi:hypothetical protein
MFFRDGKLHVAIKIMKAPFNDPDALHIHSSIGIQVRPGQARTTIVGCWMRLTRVVSCRVMRAVRVVSV